VALPHYREPGCNTTLYRSFIHIHQYSDIITANINMA
jgi:hypothetical protein